MSLANENSNDRTAADVSDSLSGLPTHGLPDALTSKTSVPKTVQLDTRIELASHSFAQKDFDRTTEHAELVLEEVPGDPRALALLAACQILVGNLDAGIVQLNQAVNGTAIDGYEAAAEAAYEHLRFCEDDTVEISWKGFNECIQFLSQPDFTTAEETAAWLAALERARACVALENENIPQAISDLKNHLRQHPDDVEARVELGRAFICDRQYALATELFRQVLDEKPEHTFALSLLARVCALEYDFANAISYATEACRLKPQNCRSRLDLAEYLCCDEQYAAAIELVADAPKCSCGWFKMLHCQLECYRDLDNFDAVLNMSEKMLACQPNEVSPDIDLEFGKRIANAHKILALAKIGQTDNAMQLLEQEADSLVANAAFALDMASLFRAFDQPEIAHRLIECTAYEHPDAADVLLALSVAESETGNLDDERILLRQLISQSPGCTLAYVRLSANHEATGHLKEALFWAFRGIANGDSQGRLEYQAGRIYAQMNALDLSRQFLASAIEANNSFRGRAAADKIFATLTK